MKAVVHVEDCNDYTPTFMSTHYEGSISNLAPTGTEVLRVKALDKDKGSNAEIVYSIHSGNNLKATILRVYYVYGAYSAFTDLNLKIPLTKTIIMF